MNPYTEKTSTSYPRRTDLEIGQLLHDVAYAHRALRNTRSTVERAVIRHRTGAAIRRRQALLCDRELSCFGLGEFVNKKLILTH